MVLNYESRPRIFATTSRIPSSSGQGCDTAGCQMSRKQALKVYGITTFTPHWSGQCRCVAAVHSQAEFAELIGSSKHYVAGYASETGNDVEVATALAKPHTLFYKPDRHSEKYVEAGTQEGSSK